MLSGVEAADGADCDVTTGNLTETQRQTIEIVRKFDNLTAREMEQRGYRVVDSAELTDADPEEIAEALVDMDFKRFA